MIDNVEVQSLFSYSTFSDDWWKQTIFQETTSRTFNRNPEYSITRRCTIQSRLQEVHRTRISHYTMWLSHRKTPRLLSIDVTNTNAEDLKSGIEKLEGTQTNSKPKEKVSLVNCCDKLEHEGFCFPGLFQLWTNRVGKMNHHNRVASSADDIW